MKCQLTKATALGLMDSADSGDNENYTQDNARPDFSSFFSLGTDALFGCRKLNEFCINVASQDETQHSAFIKIIKCTIDILDTA